MRCKRLVNSKVRSQKSEVRSQKSVLWFLASCFLYLELSGCASLKEKGDIPADIHEKGGMPQELTTKKTENSEDERWKRAAALFNNGFHSIKDDPTSAIALYNEGITLAPDRWEAYYNLGIIYMRLQDMNRAKKEFLKSSKYKAPPAMVYNALGAMYLSMGKGKEAIKYFKIAFDFEKSPVVMMNIANLYQNMGQFEESIKYYREIESTDSSNLPPHHHNIGVLMYNMGDFKNAHEEFKTAEVTEGESLQLLFYQAQTLLKLGEYEAALKIYQRIADKDSSDPTPYKNIGIIYEIYLGDMAKAFESYTAYLEKGGEKTADIESWIEIVKARTTK